MPGIKSDAAGAAEVRVALAARSVRRFSSPGEWAAVLDTETAAAAAAGAAVVVFAEYGGMEWTGFPGMCPERDDVRGQIAALQAWRDDWVRAHQAMARRHQLTVVAGSFPWARDDGMVVNRAWIAGPDGNLAYQDKYMMTRFEREEWGIRSGGQGLRVFDVAGVPMAVAICYDVEFPLIVRDAVERGARVVLTPSNTDGWHGYHRVRAGARARAMENQCVVAMVPLLGRADWTSAIDINVGRAGVFGPIDAGFPEDGVIAAGGDEGGLLVVPVSIRRLNSVRRHGQNHNHRDWEKQIPLPPAIL